MKLSRIFLLAVLITTLTGCAYGENMSMNSSTKDLRLSTWITYWDFEAGNKELKKINNRVIKVSHFAAYFNEQDRLLLPEVLKAEAQTTLKQKTKFENYLTIVNDKEEKDGKVLLKDINLLKRLFADDVVMERHIAEIIALSKKLGYQGIEIDYEQLWKDPDLAEPFTRFINKLFVEALKNDLKLRVVLEPSARFSFVNFSKGPEYVIMFYNLYGTHSGPGAKADKDFIDKTLKRMEKLPGEKTIAFANGGCIWSDNKKSFITEIEAVQLAKENSASVERDFESQALFFTYLDKNKRNCTVWYADAETIKYWMSVARKQGYTDFSIWRLGGNVDIKQIF